MLHCVKVQACDLVGISEMLSWLEQPQDAVLAESTGQVLRPEAGPCCCAAQASWNGLTLTLQKFHTPE